MYLCTYVYIITKLMCHWVALHIWYIDEIYDIDDKKDIDIDDKEDIDDIDIDDIDDINDHLP